MLTGHDAICVCEREKERGTERERERGTEILSSHWCIYYEGFVLDGHIE